MEKIISKNCTLCGNLFSYENGRGKHRKSFCSEDCAKKSFKEKSRESLRLRKERAGICIINGCRKKALRTKNTLCEAHYYQNRRTGSFDKKVYPRTADHGAYVRILGSHSKNHPMCGGKSGMLYEHRMVAYDVRNGICECCFWCGKELTWKSCVIDHLNEDKHDNRPENLLISCVNCNRARGAMLGFLANIKESSLPVFFKAINDYRDKHGKFEKKKT